MDLEGVHGARVVPGRQQAMLGQVLLVLAHNDQQVHRRPGRLRGRIVLQGVCQVHHEHLRTM